MATSEVLSEQQVKNVVTKVAYNDSDPSFYSYLELVNKITKLSTSILNGTLPESETEQENGGDAPKFDKKTILELEQSLDLKYSLLTNELDVKKSTYENNAQEVEGNIIPLEKHIQETLPDLKDYRTNILNRTRRLRAMYNTVSNTNNELYSLSTGKTTLMAKLSEWEDKLGKELTSKLRQKNYIKASSSDNKDDTQLFRVYDNFNKSPEELKYINTSMRKDIDKLIDELEISKGKWLKDAEIFNKISDILKTELINRNVKLETQEDDIDMEDVDEKVRERHSRLHEVVDEIDYIGSDEDEELDFNDKFESATDNVDENDNDFDENEETNSEDVGNEYDRMVDEYEDVEQDEGYNQQQDEEMEIVDPAEMEPAQKDDEGVVIK